MEKPDLLSLFPGEIRAIMEEIGESGWRADQIFPQVQRGVPPSGITSLPVRLREKLGAICDYRLPEPVRVITSKNDGTKKILFRLYDGECIESVVMRYRHGNSICISCQAGCRMGCVFCASCTAGCSRDMGAGEIAGQVIAAGLACGFGESAENGRISSVVMMGIGEPLDNYDNTVRFLRLISDAAGAGIGLRNISLSTCGVADKIRLLAGEGLPVTLSVSLHAHDDDFRSSIMPVNRKWGIAELLDACRGYFAATGRRISFEYILLHSKNDKSSDAEALSALLRREMSAGGRMMPLHVNLILENNPGGAGAAMHAKRRAANNFAEILGGRGITATIRRRLGADIDAACGCLRRQEQESGGNRS